MSDEKYAAEGPVTPGEHAQEQFLLSNSSHRHWSPHFYTFDRFARTNPEARRRWSKEATGCSTRAPKMQFLRAKSSSVLNKEVLAVRTQDTGGLENQNTSQRDQKRWSVFDWWIHRIAKAPVAWHLPQLSARRTLKYGYVEPRKQKKVSNCGSHDTSTTRWDQQRAIRIRVQSRVARLFWTSDTKDTKSCSFDKTEVSLSHRST
jgi:hypothetical protein